MPEFVYKAVDSSGKNVEGTILADTIELAAESLKRRQLYIIDLREKGVWQKDISVQLRKKIAIKDLAVFCRQFATMLMAGIPMVSALDVIVEQFKGKYLGKVLEDIYKRVQSGTMLSRALAEKAECFPPILINMIEAGEMSGSVDQALDRMATHFEKELKLRQKIINALIYPAIVILVAIGVLIIMLTFVVPTFVGIFSELNVELPATTRFIISSSNFMRNNLILIIIVCILFVVAYKVIRKTDKGGFYIDKFKLQIPVIGKIILGQIVTRFTRTLGTMTAAGVSIVIALETTKNVMTNVFVEKKFEEVIDRVQKGEGLSYPIADVGIFPRLVEIMIRTGEESGNLEYMLNKAADYYENEVENQVTRLTSIFEPIMIVLLAIMVGFLLASIILPIFKLYGSVGA
ncbi:type II secretion system F family protein [Caldicellulosiruptor naganoensis]|uniref:Type II secretion system F family protein n=1 Tax=Caldicellulosiruptor naganoensis TaxID=29324 RepID=A0ABY7BHJ1_9FIRM|nr:type II secretion system F family protein [Caldicellulosiruptor naganoensis]WAM32303.1 type II secretion system F family protein [Caldicellulosiruptor naganoensis]